MIACRFGDFAIFMFGFAKNERENISARDLSDLRSIAAQWFEDRSKVEKDRVAGILIEVKREEGE